MIQEKLAELTVALDEASKVFGIVEEILNPVMLPATATMTAGKDGEKAPLQSDVAQTIENATYSVRLLTERFRAVNSRLDLSSTPRAAEFEPAVYRAPMATAARR